MIIMWMDWVCVSSPAGALNRKIVHCIARDTRGGLIGKSKNRDRRLFFLGISELRYTVSVQSARVLTEEVVKKIIYW